MANIKISELNEATLPLDGTEDLPIVDAGVTKRCSTQDIADLALRHTKVTLSSAQILSMVTTPVTLVAAQGAGTVIFPVSYSLRVNYGTSAYTAGAIRIGTGADFDQLASVSNVLSVTQNTFFRGFCATADSVGGTNTAANTACKITCAGSDPTGGNGTLDVYLSYYVITL